MMHACVRAGRDVHGVSMQCNAMQFIIVIVIVIDRSINQSMESRCTPFIRSIYQFATTKNQAKLEMTQGPTGI